MQKRITSLLALILMVCMATTVFAQNVMVTGIVTDTSNEPLIGVNVLVKGTATGAITDINGKFSVQISGSQAVLVFTYVGYLPQEIPVGNQRNMNVIMREDSQGLEEVVVVGYGVQRKATLTGSVAQVAGEVLKQAPTANLSNSLVGRLPGVIANNRSGQPGSDNSDIFIRGKSTLGNNTPLYVIDGLANFGDIQRLNPSDIESVSVLKDVSASIYGAQAANGVILITTKRGNSGKPVITYEGNFGLSQNTRTPHLMNSYQYMVYNDEAEAYLGRIQQFKDVKGGYLDGTIDKLLWADTDWCKVILRNAPQTQHSLSIRGGNEKVKYFISGGYFYQEPAYKKTTLNFNTMQLRSNIDAQITKDLTVSLDIALRQENRNNSNDYTSGDGVYYEVFNTYPYIPDFYPNGLPGPGLSWGNNLVLWSRGLTGYNRIAESFINYKVSFDLKMPWLLDGLSLSGYVAQNVQFRVTKTLSDLWDVYRYNPATGEYDNIRATTGHGNINLTQRLDNNRITTLHFKLGYEKRFNAHSINTFIAFEQSKASQDWFSAYRRDFLSSAVDYLFAGSDNLKDSNGSGSITARQNYFGRLSYGYMDKYLAEFSIRYDGSHNFASENRWGLFPGLSLGWRISEEDFFKDHVAFINGLKIKTSWGRMGNDRIAAFQYLSTYTLGNGMPFGPEPQSTKGFTIGRLANPNITWESSDTKNIGFESLFLNRRISFDFEYFYSVRTDILATKQASVPLYTGITLPDQNIGKVSNRGIETSLMYRDKVGNFNYNFGGNLTFARNKIIYFDEAKNTPEWQRRTGYSMDSWLVYLTDGIYQRKEDVDATPHRLNTQAGDIKLLDVDGNGSITTNDRVRIYYGSTPQIVYGINMGGSWNGIELNILWTGQGRARQIIRPSTFNADVDYYNGRWLSAEKTPNSKYPRAFNTRTDTFNRDDSDFWLRNASFLRLKNVELAYNFPSSVLNKIRISNLRVYLSGFNLFSIDYIKIQDPESTNAGGTYYPQQRVYNMGLTMSF